MLKRVLLLLVPTSVQDYHFKGYAGARARMHLLCLCPAYIDLKNTGIVY